jgi:uncharacterized protein
VCGITSLNAAALDSQGITSPIKAIGSTEWDELAANRFYSSSKWLGFCAQDGNIRASAAYGRLPDGTRAVVPVAEVSREPNPFYRWADEIAARGLPALPPAGLLIGPHIGYQTHLLAPAAADPVATARALLTAVHEFPLADHAAPRVAMYLGTADVRALRAAGAGSMPVLLRLDAAITVPSDGWDAWLDGLGTRRRAAIVRREVSKFAAAGYQVTEAALSGWTDTVGRLISNTQSRYGHPADPAPRIELLRRMAQQMGDAARVLLCSLPGEGPTGYCLFYRWGDTIFLRSAGFDYQRLRGAAEYFNLVYYLPVQMAAREGRHWLHAGIESTEAKALRGAQLRPLWLLDLSPDSPLRHYPARVLAANRRQAARLRAVSPIIAKAWPAEADPDAAQFGI